MGGNVGINETNPSNAKLKITNSTASLHSLKIEQSGSGGYWAFDINNTNTDDSYGLRVQAGNDANDRNSDFLKRDGTSILQIFGDGNVKVNNGNLVIGTAGKGIDFSNQTTATGGSNQSELLDHYETGTFTPNIVNYDGSQFADFSTHSRGVYARVGDLIWVTVYLQQNSYTQQRLAADCFLTNLPFTPYSSIFHTATGVIQNTRSNYNSGSADDGVITLRHTTHLSGAFTLYYYNGQVIEEGNFQDGSGNSRSVYLFANFSYRSQ